MAGWFTNLIKFIPGNDILASEVDGKLDAIAKSLNDHLPEPRTDGVPGFSAPCAVGEPTEEYHATPVSKILKMNIATDSGVANEYQLTLDIMPSSYTDGMEIWFKPAHTNTGASTAQIGSLGNVPLKKANGSDLSAGDLDVNSYAGFRFNGTEFRAISLLGGDADDVEESKQWADESKQWAIGEPTEPTEHSAKWWAESVNGLSYMRSNIAAQGGIGADAVNVTIDWNDPEVAIAGCSTHYLKGSNPNAPPQAVPNVKLHSFCFEYAHKNGSSQSDIVQFAISEFGDQYIRSRKDGIWSTWVQFFTSAGGAISGSVYPSTDNLYSLGAPLQAWNAVSSYSYITASDERKKDIKDLGDTSWIYDLRPIAYEWKDKPTGLRYGFGAQTTYKVMPNKTANLVQKPKKKEDTWSMQPDQLIPLLLNELKILRQRIEQLEAK